MPLFHATTTDGAAQIDTRGFTDAAGYYRPDVDRSGVWVSDQPCASQAGGGAPVLYAIEAT
ncbi:MAG: hypothetical protein O9284_10135 [Steroidobacteraceae bacterium]|jgi:hypothetical protein|nr:hypothetical protein [Steroidobacteraceae bacterium]